MTITAPMRATLADAAVEARAFLCDIRSTGDPATTDDIAEWSDARALRVASRYAHGGLGGFLLALDMFHALPHARAMLAER